MNDTNFWPGFILGAVIAGSIFFIGFAFREEQTWIKPAVQHGFGRFVVDSPTSPTAHWEWITNRAEGGAK